MKRFINLDMDGVVADFNKFAGEILGRTIGWEGRDLSDDEWKTLASIDRLYYRLPVCERASDIVSTARQLKKQHGLGLRFLTAIPRRTTMPTAEEDKKDWARDHFPGVTVEIGPYSKDKKIWCDTLDILVDDKRSNVTEWYEAGGIAIYHDGNVDLTLQLLTQAATMNEPALLGPLAHVG